MPDDRRHEIPNAIEAFANFKRSKKKVLKTNRPIFQKLRLEYILVGECTDGAPNTMSSQDTGLVNRL